MKITVTESLDKKLIGLEIEVQGIEEYCSVTGRKSGWANINDQTYEVSFVLNQFECFSGKNVNTMFINKVGDKRTRKSIDNFIITE